MTLTDSPATPHTRRTPEPRTTFLGMPPFPTGAADALQAAGDARW